MLEYNFWADLFDTYQSTADWIKALWIVTVPSFLLGLLGIVLHYRLQGKRTDTLAASELVYTIHRDEDGFRVYQQTDDPLRDLAVVLPNDNPPHGPVPMLKNAVGDRRDSSVSARGAQDTLLG